MTGWTVFSFPTGIRIMPGAWNPFSPRFQLIRSICPERILSPIRTLTPKGWLPKRPFLDNANNNSVILRLTHGSNCFLMMGDAEQEEEAALLASGFPVSANVLKLGHHGENDASLNPQVQKRLEQCSITPYFSECDGLGIDFVSDHGTICLSAVEDASSDSEAGTENDPNKK